ncbi:MAG: hypothetical protein WC683_03040 [bacterium]
MKALCPCGRIATWFYMLCTPAPVVYCDACVPRNCACGVCQQFGEERDEQGRLTPCIWWAEEPHGVDDSEPGWIAHDQPFEQPEAT